MSNTQAEREMLEAASPRFFDKIVRIPIGGCWVWMGATQHNGYGFFHMGGKTVRSPMRAHRFSWEFHIGAIPVGMHVCHSCDNPQCVNPDHLFLGTRSDNMRDCASKGRICTIGKALLTHCKNGHEFTSENTRFNKHGHRRCGICADLRDASRRISVAAIRAKDLA